MQSDGASRGLSKIGVVAVAPGDGFRALFPSMGAAAIVEGGQTMNPSRPGHPGRDRLGRATRS